MDKDRLTRIARTVLEQAIACKPGERVLAVGNPEDTSRLICDAYFQAILELGGQPLLLRQTPRGLTDFADATVLAAIATEPEVIISISTDKIGKDPHGLHIGHVGRDGRRYPHILDRVNEGDHRVRVGSSPGIKMDTFLRAMEIDYAEVRTRAAALRDAVQGVSEMHVETPAGTDLTVGLRGRGVFADDGDLRSPGKHGNLPCGEIFFSPELRTARGKIVFDSVIAIGPECIIPTEPLAMEVADGYVTRVLPSAHSEAVVAVLKEGEAKARAMGLEEHARNTWGIGEVGMGLNPKAQLVPDMLEAEKVGGTCHVAIGLNYDRDLPALTHYDMLMTRPRITVDGRPLPGYDL